MFSDPSPARAHVQFNPDFGKLEIALQPSRHTLIRWPLHAGSIQQRLEENSPTVEADLETSPWLRMDPELARALYQSLGEFFGHSGNDVRALRKDYDAERARVDKLITHLTETAPLVIERQHP